MNADTIASLCAAIDAGDDTVVPILADALEDAGLPLVAGLRRIGNYVPSMWPSAVRGGPVHGWRIRNRKGDSGLAAIPEHVWDRLPSPILETRRNVDWAFYVSPSAAYLALAEALS